MLSALRQLNSDRDYGQGLGIAARERVLHHFTQEQFLQQVRQIYVGVAGALPAPRPFEAAKQAVPYELEEQARLWGTHDA